MAAKNQLLQLQLFDPGATQARLTELRGGNRGLDPQRTPLIHLATIAEVFAFSNPEHQSEFEFVKKYLLRAANRTQEGDSRLILRALGLLGTATVADIAARAALPYSSTQTHLKRLAKLRMVVKIKAPAESGRGGNKRGYLYALPEA